MFTIAIPSRHRCRKLDDFFLSLKNSMGTRINELNQILLILDNPNNNDETISKYTTNYPDANVIINSYKSGLARLWNQCIINSPTDWVMICNDDIIFQDGWYDFALSKIKSNKYLQVNIRHYGAFILHKKMILLNGWFDEHFDGGGYEDNDWQLRISENGLNDSVYEWKDEYRLIYHNKKDDIHNWTDCNNPEFINIKWSRNGNFDWLQPSIRAVKEIDWYPKFTSEFESKYGLKSRISEINSAEPKEVWHWKVKPNEQKDCVCLQ